MTDARPDAVTLRPDSATGYSVAIDGRYIGRVERNRNGWSWSTINGGCGSSYRTRKAAVAAVREIANPGCARAVPGLRG